MSDEQAYVLGTGADESVRLAHQHAVWRGELLTLVHRGGLRPGGRWADLGSGPGHTTLELARELGPSGEVLACDASPRFLQQALANASAPEHARVLARPGDVEALDLPADSLDGAYARWLLCWLAHPGRVLEALARALRPGAQLCVHDYLDWGAMTLAPACPAFERVVEACMGSWAAGEGTIDVALELPRLAREAGLELLELTPLARCTRAGSPEWRWIGEFFASYAPRLVGAGRLTAEELQAWRTAWAQREADGVTWIRSPVVAAARLRRPDPLR